MNKDNANKPDNKLPQDKAQVPETKANFSSGLKPAATQEERERLRREQLEHMNNLGIE